MHCGFTPPRSALLCAMLATLSLVLPGCSPEVDPDAIAGAETEAVAEEPESESDEVEEPQAFSPDRLPLSDASLGEFPFFALPEGYFTKPRNESTQALGQFAFWTGAEYIQANGRIYQGNIQPVDGKVFSSAELSLALEEQITRKGGVLIADSVVPSGARAEVLTRTFVDEYSKGLCWPTEPVRTYVVRQLDRHVWVHACTYGDIGGGWVIAEIPVPRPETPPLTAAGLLQALSEAGEAELGLQYVAGQAIPSDADTLVAALTGLMEREPEAVLDIHGRAGTGLSAEERHALGLARARYLQDALVAAGMAAGRLVVQGSDREGVPGVTVSYASAP